MKDHPSYRILDLLGTSPTTEVHRAWDDSPLQRDVAIKMLRGDAAAVEHVRRQFWERVKAMADLRHERLLPVFSTDTERDWVILELADDNAAARIARGPVPAGEVQSYLAQVLEGLEALHAKGRLHGRIKPSNLLLYKSGRLKLADPGALVDGDLQLVPGAEKYLAPELADSTGRFGAGRPGPGLDLYGAAFCALEMLAGPKFDGMFPGMTAGGADTAALWWKWHASAADPRELVDTLVPASAGRLREALRSMLAKPVAERADSARAVLDTLGTAAIPEEIRVDAQPPAPASPAGEVAARQARVSEIRYAPPAGGAPQITAAPEQSRPVGAGTQHHWRVSAVAAAVALAMLLTGFAAWSWIGSAREQARLAAALKKLDEEKAVLAKAAEEKAKAEKAAEVEGATQAQEAAEKAAREQEAAVGKAKREQIERDALARLQAKPPEPPGPIARNDSFKPAERLPPVPRVAGYKKLEDKTIRFALHAWGGWAPIIYANQGFRPGKVWKTPDGKPFKVELMLLDNAVEMRDAYASGDVHIGWATLDTVPLFLEGFVDGFGKPRHPEIMPRIYQQVDFSNGGDGIVVRDTIKTVGDLAGETLVLTPNSPSHFLALTALVAGGVQPADVKMVYTNGGLQAAASFDSDPNIAGSVSWAPDIDRLAATKGNRMLISTRTANRLIAHVWFARSDFATDHPDKIEGLVRGIFDAMQELNADGAKAKIADLMGDGFAIPAQDAAVMLADAHSTNWAENHQFFVNRDNPANFERLWNQAYGLYRGIGSITHRPVPYGDVMDSSLIEKLGKEPKYAETRDEYDRRLPPRSLAMIRSKNKEVLTKTVVIHFFPNSANLRKTIVQQIDGKVIEELYDQSVDLVLSEVAQIAKQLSNARIVIEGHSDSSMQGQVPAELVRVLSLERASAVRDELIANFGFDRNRFAVDGLGWDRPVKAEKPDDHARNRRVEVRFYSVEQE